MLYLLLPLLLGMLTAKWLPEFPILITSLTILSLISILIWRWAKVLIYVVIAGVGYIIVSLDNPLSEPIVAQKDVTLSLESGTNGEAVITSISSSSGENHQCYHKVLLWGGDSLDFKELHIQGDIRPIDPKQNSYYATMDRKGFVASVKVNNILSIKELEHTPLSARMNRWAISRLRSLELPKEAFALSAAVGLARREELDKETIENYNRSGVAHLLSLSGLHLGVIMLIISAFTFFMSLMRNGHIVADVIAIIAIWLFAFMVGLSESVTRAAWMFSLLKLSSILSRRYNSLNALFTAAVAILCLNPSSLYDLGFALSVTAVAAIIVVGVPLCKLVATDYKVLDFVSTSLIISCVATISTAPIISNAFGYVVLLSPLTTLPLLLTIFVIILATTLWVICPFPQLAPLFYWTLEVATTIQNYLVEWFASWKFGVIDYRLSDFGLAASYIIVIIVGWMVVKIVPHTEPQQRISTP